MKERALALEGELPLLRGVKTCTAETYIECEQKLDTLVLRYGSLLNLYAKDTLCHCALEWRKQQEEDGIDVNTLETQRYHIEVSIAPGALGEKLGRTNVIDLTVDDFNMLWRLLARKGGKRGKGLGLSALKHIRRYNQKLWIRDRLKGATYPPS